MFKAFEECEAAALAQINGEYNPFPNNEALLQGNWLHSYFESKVAHERFIENNKKLLSKKNSSGILKKYTDMDELIDSLKNVDAFVGSYVGEKEVILTGSIFELPWKGKVDLLNVEEGYFIDLKTVADINETWYNPDSHSKDMNFIVKREYPRQMAVYKLLLEQKYEKKFTPYIWAVDKTQSHAVRMYRGFTDSNLGVWIDDIQANQDRIWSVIHGYTEPNRCERCNYCKSTYDSSVPLNFWEV